MFLFYSVLFPNNRQQPKFPERLFTVDYRSYPSLFFSHPTVGACRIAFQRRHVINQKIIRRSQSRSRFPVSEPVREMIHQYSNNDCCCCRSSPTSVEEVVDFRTKKKKKMKIPGDKKKKWPIAATTVIRVLKFSRLYFSGKPAVPKTKTAESFPHNNNIIMCKIIQYTFYAHC